jgi:hypothetical protein
MSRRDPAVPTQFSLVDGLLLMYLQMCFAASRLALPGDQIESMHLDRQRFQLNCVIPIGPFILQFAIAHQQIQLYTVFANSHLPNVHSVFQVKQNNQTHNIEFHAIRDPLHVLRQLAMTDPQAAFTLLMLISPPPSTAPSMDGQQKHLHSTSP